MVIDTSALMAILQDEPERSDFIRAIERAESRVMSSATLVESSILLETRYGPAGVRDLDLFLARAGVEIIDVDREQADLARHAHGRYGRGNHPANLNMGDCFAYALARSTGQPLLAKGDGFPRTDLRLADVWPT